jgi:hypothetical protein
VVHVGPVAGLFVVLWTGLSNTKIQTCTLVCTSLQRQSRIRLDENFDDQVTIAHCGVSISVFRKQADPILL